jgi:hypothetical protein
MATAKKSGGFLIRYLDLTAFLVALTVGLLVVFLMAPRKKVVYRFPSPTNADTVYTDAEGECYRFQANKVNCGSFHKDELKDQPGDTQ